MGGYLRTSLTGTAVAIALAWSPFALAQRSGTPPQTRSMGPTTAMISPAVVANWFVESQADGHDWLQLLVLWRGSVGWFLREGGSSVSGRPFDGLYHITMIEGGLRLTIDYDFSKRIVVLQGKTVDITRGNVVFVDDVDSPAGPQVTRTMRVERIIPWSAPQIGLVLRASPEILSFLRCDATLPGSPWQGFLEQLCLQNIGIVK